MGQCFDKKESNLQQQFRVNIPGFEVAQPYPKAASNDSISRPTVETIATDRD